MTLSLINQIKNTRPSTWRGRIGWFILIWATSVLCLGLVAFALRLLMNFVGLTA